MKTKKHLLYFPQYKYQLHGKTKTLGLGKNEECYWDKNKFEK